MTGLETNIFPITNLADLCLGPTASTGSGASGRTRAEYHQNRQIIARKLSFAFRTPAAVIEHDGEAHLVLRADAPEPVSPYPLVRRIGLLRPAPGHSAPRLHAPKPRERRDLPPLHPVHAPGPALGEPPALAARGRASPSSRSRRPSNTADWSATPASRSGPSSRRTGGSASASTSATRSSAATRSRCASAGTTSAGGGAGTASTTTATGGTTSSSTSSPI